mmetsp:Transcript_39999/g.85318  ORF Transcript_39999/g.85318 Transcript_39999/m.85318 type:complete len:399 (-) Transcript_39999:1819-3015(-)
MRLVGRRQHAGSRESCAGAGGNPVQGVREGVPIGCCDGSAEAVAGEAAKAATGCFRIQHGLLQAHRPRPALVAFGIRVAIRLVIREVLGHPARLERGLRGWCEGKQLNTTDDVAGCTEPALVGGCMLPKDAYDLVVEGVPIDAAVSMHMPISVSAMHLHGCQQSAEVLELLCERRVHRRTIDVERVVAIDGLAGAALVAAVGHGLDAPCPRKAQEPVLVACQREAGICRRRIAIVPDDGQDLLPPCPLPGGIVLCQDGRSVDEVAVVKVVVVVESVPKVHAGVGQRWALLCRLHLVGAMRLTMAMAVVVDTAAGQHPTPGGIVDKGRLGVRLQPDLQTLGEPIHHLLEILLTRLSELVCDGHEAGQTCQHLPREIGVAHSHLVVEGEVEVGIAHCAIP